jgi:hypothetical protein
LETVLCKRSFPIYFPGCSFLWWISVVVF